MIIEENRRTRKRYTRYPIVEEEVVVVVEEEEEEEDWQNTSGGGGIHYLEPLPPASREGREERAGGTPR